MVGRLALGGQAASSGAVVALDAGLALHIRKGQSEKPLAAQQVQLDASVAMSLSVKFTMSV